LPAEWEPQQLAELRELPGVAEVLWQGGYKRTQVAGETYVVPYHAASPGYLTTLGHEMVAGRDLTAEDAGRFRLVVSEQVARELFSDSELEDALGREVRLGTATYEIVGIYAGSGVAVYARTRPESSPYGGRYDVMTVYLRTTGVPAERVASEANRWLTGQPGLAGIEAVSYREFRRPSVVFERIDHVRELTRLFGWLVAAAVGLAALNLLNQGFLEATARRRALAVYRVLGASHAALALLELRRMLLGQLPAVLAGVALGAAMGAYLGGLVGWRPLVLAGTVGLVSTLVGALPLVVAAMRLYPYRVLRESAGALRQPLIATLGSVGMAVAAALLVLAGGFAMTGRAELTREIEGIGADLVEFRSDWGSIRPAALLGEGDLRALQEAFPEVPMTLVRSAGSGATAIGTVAAGVEVLAAAGDYADVSGTRLLSGRWPAPGEAGAVLGAAAAEALFPEGEALGRTVRLSLGEVFGTVEVAVTGVAAPPDTERLESLQLPARAVFLSREALPHAPGMSRLYLRAGALSEVELVAAERLLSERHADKAPLRPQFVAATYQNWLGYLEEQLQHFGLVAVLLFFLAAIGLATVLFVREHARLYRYALERALGADRQRVRTEVLVRAVRYGLAIGGLGGLVGSAGFLLWANLAGYTGVFPLAWVLFSIGLAACLGGVAGLVVAGWAASKPPLELLRSEG
jgi:putative ABC transport system permease protein